MICYGQHTAISFVTFATAHCSFTFVAVTVVNGAADAPRPSTATFRPTSTVRLIVCAWATPFPMMMNI